MDMRLKDYKEALESFRLAADLAPGISGACDSAVCTGAAG